MTVPDLSRLRGFVYDFAALLSQTRDEARILEIGGAFLRDLVSHDDWLPDAFAEPTSAPYAQHLLHCDSLERFSVVSFVWGPREGTPVHDHTVWGLIGVLRGAELSQPYATRAVEASKPMDPPVRLDARRGSRRSRRGSATSTRSPTPSPTALRSASTSMGPTSARWNARPSTPMEAG